jgi:hypothetical protein
VYTVLGNHDYVLNPAPLYFEVNLPGVDDRKFHRWGGYNLTREEARSLQGGHVPTISVDESFRLLQSNEDALPYYLSEINRDRNYLVEIDGGHRVVMLDSGPNKDVLSSREDAIEHYLGFSNEDERSFVRELPTTDGQDDDSLARAAKLEGGGVFVLGMHSPPVNPWGNEYAHFFRETERVAMGEDRLRDLTRRFVMRQDPRVAPGPDGSHPAWFTGRRRHFKRGTIGDLLDFGIAKLRSAAPDAFLRQLLDAKVDVVLCGHVHERVEFRVGIDDGELRLFTDFYTENPTRYREGWDWTRVVVARLGSVTTAKYGDERPIFVRVDRNAVAGALPRETTDHSRDGLPRNAPEGTITVSRTLAVPPYDDPLSDATAHLAWWRKHRPLILQTACLGPIDKPQRPRIDADAQPPRASRPHQSFQGVRLVSVEGDHITRVSYVGMEEIRALPPVVVSPNTPKRDPAVSPVAQTRPRRRDRQPH